MFMYRKSSARLALLLALIPLFPLAENRQSEAAKTLLSPKSLAYACELGGTTQKGKTLFLLVGAVTDSEANAQKMLDEAIPCFGDMQDYFIIQHSDSFRGSKTRGWMLVEAYLQTPAQENLDFARRAFPQAHVEQVTVLTSDPIPVYESLVGE